MSSDGERNDAQESSRRLGGGCFSSLIFYLVVGFFLFVVSNLPDEHPLSLAIGAATIAIPVVYFLYAVVEYVTLRLREEQDEAAGGGLGPAAGQTFPSGGAKLGEEHVEVVLRLARAVCFLAVVPGGTAFIILISGGESGISRWYAVPAVAAGAGLVALAGRIGGGLERDANSPEAEPSGTAGVPALNDGSSDPDQLVQAGRYAEALEAYREQGIEYLRIHPRASAFPVELEAKIRSVEALLDGTTPPHDPQRARR